MNDLIKKSDLEAMEQEFAPLLEAFRKKLAEKPDPKVVKSMRGFKYMPIELIEARLDSMYNGLWSVENLKYSVEINSVVVSLDLKVFHPIAKTWIVRSGVASVPVQLDAKTQVLKPTALQKNVPSCKAIAVKNAAQSLGRAFGRNINRGWDVPHLETESNFDNVKI